ncbi:MAG: glycoside hydrolase family 125 protein, partial [Fidelibacterota bacterium]
EMKKGLKLMFRTKTFDTTNSTNGELNMKRREFIASSLVAGAVLSNPMGLFAKENYKSRRPLIGDRTFSSIEVEKLITEVKAAIKDPEIAWMFENCYPNTLDTTVDYEIIEGKPDTFIITGDIDAMWLRDSTAQVWPYMPLITKEEKLKNLILGLVNRQVKCVLKDPYANAFYKDLTKETEWASDKPTPIDGVHERKWEIDSLCYVVRLSNRYFELTKDQTVFDTDWDRAMRTIVRTFRTEQRKDGTTPYRFVRKTTTMIDAPVFNGTGRPVKPTGLICSAFRPSDDATMYPYLIPSNLFAVQSLRQLSGIYRNIMGDPEFARECAAFADEVEMAVNKYAVAEHLDFGKIYAYEVDGFGNKVFMDDANVPSLMSLAYLGAHKETDKLYRNTREFLLSDANPYFLKSDIAEGQASPHTGKDMIWPMGIILRAMTSTNVKEITHCLKMLKATHAGTGFMHEAFLKDNPEKFNRAWFAWANTLFGELIIKIYHENPSILA